MKSVVNFDLSLMVVNEIPFFDKDGFAFFVEVQSSFVFLGVLVDNWFLKFLVVVDFILVNFFVADLSMGVQKFKRLDNVFVEKIGNERMGKAAIESYNIFFASSCWL
jgi:hypothetical protein